jgi:UDP-N-acetylglucosamine diphosphorylase/glucosamine-1-phosphate N-acetyltransferase
VTTPAKLIVLVLAAGKGTRMKDPGRAKVMIELHGKPMVHYVVDLAYSLRASRVIVIVGYQKESVMEYIRKSHPDAQAVIQAEQLGTGHAVLQSAEALKDTDGDLLVLSGDVPLLRKRTLESLIRNHRLSKATATILTADLEDPTGYGRVIRNEDGSVRKIVEERDANPVEKAVREINSGIYLFHKRALFEGLKHISPHNAQKEYYLTDVFEYFWRNRMVVSGVKASHPDEIHGINTVEQLEAARVSMLVPSSRQ